MHQCTTGRAGMKTQSATTCLLRRTPAQPGAPAGTLRASPAEHPQPTYTPAREPERVSGGPTEIPIMSARVALLATIRQLWPELQAWVHARTHARPSPPRLVRRPGLQARIRSAPDRRRHTRQAHAWTTAILHATSLLQRCQLMNARGGVHVLGATAHPCGVAGWRGERDRTNSGSEIMQHTDQGSRVPAA